jgi:HlyD family secretion protein
MKRKLILSALIAVVLAIIGYAVFARGSSSKYSYRYDTISEGDVTTVVMATGTISAVTSVDVGTQVSGTIAKLYADFNSVVKKGDVIALIDTTFLAQSVTDAEASLESARAQWTESKRNLDREKALVDRGLDSKQNYEASLTTYETNGAALKSAEAALDRAKINLAYATIRAPIDGVVIDRAVNVGQTVAASFSSPTLYTIANDLSKMQVLTTVDESDIGNVSMGQEATFSVEAYPDETFRGTISQIRLAPVSVQNVVNYTVVIDVDNKSLELMPGMTATVKIAIQSDGRILRVPNLALRFQPPTDAIDSTALNTLRASYATRGAESGATSQVQPAAADPDTALSRRASGGKALSLPAASLQKSQQNEQFGITSLYPEYEKSTYIPRGPNVRGRLWAVNERGLLEPLFVRTGISDGRYTEVSGRDLKPGVRVVLGITGNGGGGSSSTTPLLGGGGNQRFGGGFR